MRIASSSLSRDAGASPRRNATAHEAEGFGVEPRIGASGGAARVLDGRFEITGPPRQGGMGSVHRAKDHDTGATVAVKFLAPLDEDAGRQTRRKPTDSELKRFQRECEMYALLGGQGVPKLIAYRLTGSDPYLVTDFIEGSDLREFLLTNRPSLTVIASIAVQLLRVLARVHSCEVVHRDVKPHNILIAKDGTVYLVDFGIALPGDPQATRHTEGVTPGSIGYKAPEIILGERNPTPAADVYGLGCTLFRLVTGRQVFPGTGTYVIERHHCETPAPLVSEFADGLPAEVVRITARMLAKDPSARPSVAQVEAVFEVLVPKKDDPAPAPSCRPDPTLPFRTGGAFVPPPADRVRRTTRPRVQRPDPGGPTRADLRDLLDRASAEVSRGEPGPGIEHLALLLLKAGRKWSEADHDVVAGRLIHAEALRISGDWVTAGSHYRRVSRQLEAAEAGSPHREFLIEARLGAAECLCEERRDDEALQLWSWATEAVITLGSTAPPRLVARCREVGDYLAEHGHVDTVARLLRQLPPA
ncbi:protein kinase [Kitasatospora sp. NPDC058032]|uniref:serine/threonine-protein kinase n=1 Tax=Kitasatospora sp. NPDC058032 TaxID=3346307 RepID=UPI0036DC3181